MLWDDLNSNEFRDLRTAAINGNSYAQFFLGYAIYYRNAAYKADKHEVSNIDASHYWLKKSAAQNNPWAHDHIGHMYFHLSLIHI